MLLSDFNLIFFCFFILLASIVINNNTALHLLLTAELLWITLFGLALTVGLFYNNLNLLALTFFFLVLSAIEFGIGLVIMIIQNTLTRSINLSDSNYNPIKFSTRFKTALFINRSNWKF